MNQDNRSTWLDEICANCGLTRGKHSGADYYSDWYSMHVPADYCPDPDGRMHWIDGPGTCFEPTAKFKED